MTPLRDFPKIALVAGIWIPIFSVAIVVGGAVLTSMYLKSCWKLDWFPEK